MVMITIPSKVQWSLSFQMHHMRYEGVVPHTSKVPFQDSNIASTELGITQLTPYMQSNIPQIPSNRTM